MLLSLRLCFLGTSLWSCTSAIQAHANESCVLDLANETMYVSNTCFWTQCCTQRSVKYEDFQSSSRLDNIVLKCKR